MELNYLHTPVKTIVDPPIDTNCQQLPLEKLAWEDFEKLCLAMVEIDHSIDNCEIYGIKGQAQQGIDIYARHSNGLYSSYQCKRYQEFKETDLVDAVNYFKKKKFYKKSERLYLCTTSELNKVQAQDKFEELKTELQKQNIELIKWDKIQLSRILKKHAQIVYDFFGSEWVKKFNGENALKNLSTSKKLDATNVIKYRKELYEFYSTIFNIQDPGIPVKEIDTTYPIQERFIVPDIISDLKDLEFGNDRVISTGATVTKIDLQQEQLFYEDNWYEEEEDHIRRKQKNYLIDSESTNLGIRINIDEALIHSNKNIIIGDPGMGKSTLLRYIVLDILCPSPTLVNISQKYGKLLPIWLPFAFITKYLSQNDSLSISQILKLWFNSVGKENLYEFAEAALKDERLLLVIDGIDEWNNIGSAQQALNRIETIRKLYDCQVIYSSRPYGFRLLKDFFTNPTVLNLAGFSNTQQQEFVEKWYKKWCAQQPKTLAIDKTFVQRQSSAFISELQKTGDLKKLAETPLLISILIVQKLRDAVLPKNKLEALSEITHYLINKHPIKRSTDAGIVEDNSSDIDFFEIFCELAINIQRESNDGVILKEDACKTIANFLVEYANYDLVTAKAKSRKLIEVGANNFGIIVEKSNEEISFGHKQFQEYLAAKHLLDSDEEQASEFIEKYAIDPSFHQTIVNFFGLIPLKQTKRYNKYFKKLKNTKHKDYQANYLKLLSYEIVLSLENAPSEIQNNLLEEIFREFEFETDELYKEALLKRILEGLKNPRLNDRIVDFILRYFPLQILYRDPRIQSFQKIGTLSKIQIDFVKKALINGTIEAKYDASMVLNKHLKNVEVFEFIKNTIQNCFSPDIIAYAVNAAITDNQDNKELDNLVLQVDNKFTIVSFFHHKYKIFKNLHHQEDLQSLVRVVNQLPYQLREEAIEVLIRGYGTVDKLKEIALNSTKKNNKTGNGTLVLDPKIAWKVLLHCYNEDKAVIERLQEEFEYEKYPLSSIDPLHMLEDIPHYFKENEIIKSAVSKWLLSRAARRNSYDKKFAMASIFIGSDEIKDLLLANLEQSNFSYWTVTALIKGWPGNQEIKEKLKHYFRTGDHEKISSSTGYIPEVFDINEKNEAIQMLEKILFDENITFRERAITALIQLDSEYFESKLLPRIINEIDKFEKGPFDQYYTVLGKIAESFHTNPEVKSLLLNSFRNDIYLSRIIAAYYPTCLDENFQDLNKSLHLNKRLRLMIMEHFYELERLPKKIEEAFLGFELEEDNDIKSDMAICVFQHIKSTSDEKVIAISHPLVFSEGYNYDNKKNIAFNGYLLSQKLDEYFKLENKGNTAHPFIIFDEYDFQKNNRGLIHRSIIENFDYLIAHVGRDFKMLSREKMATDSIEFLWSFYAERSVKSSPTFPYILEYINRNSNSLTDSRLISFLNRTLPNSPLLKQILLQIIDNPEAKNKALAGTFLGTQFKDDIEVFENVRNVTGIQDVGRILALCRGWKSEPVLKEIFDNIELDSTYSNDYVYFSLMFIFKDLDYLEKFIDFIFNDIDETTHAHKFFFVPMVERMKTDDDFVKLLKKILRTTNDIHRKISCFNLLSLIDKIDSEVTNWKEAVTDFKNDYGYDIVSNKTVRLRDILHDYYF